MVVYYAFRLYIENHNAGLGLRLYIEEIGSQDAGSYTCEADVEGRRLLEETSLSLFGQ